MQVVIESQKVEVDLNDIAYSCAQGDVVAFGEMLSHFSDMLEEREKVAGFGDLLLFDTAFGIWVKHLSEPQLRKLKDVVSENI